MSNPISRRDALKVLAAGGLAALPTGQADAGPFTRPPPGWVSGHMTGSQALAETLIQEGVDCVFGIPGAQFNELWDTFKSKHLGYLLVTHEFSAAVMADGVARSTGKPGVLCVVPGPGLTNSLSGIGEALLDSVPLVCIVGDVDRGEHAHAFQVHDLPQTALLEKVTKGVIQVRHAAEIPGAVRQAFQFACCGEPGPVGVVIPYPLLLEAHRFHSGPLPAPDVPFDEAAFHRALGLLSDRRLRVGIYAGWGCMNYAPALVRLAEVLQAPVATSIAGKGVIPETHPLSVGWGYGPQGTKTAADIFKHVDVVLALGVRFSEVSTGFYSQPQPGKLIQVDANPHNLGRVLRTDVCVHADAGLFMDMLLQHADAVRRPCDRRLLDRIRALHAKEFRTHHEVHARCGADPMHLLLTLRRCTAADALAFIDVTCSQYWATEVFTACGPRTFFNPTNNQAMGWSIPAAIGAQRVLPGRQVVTVTGDGCFLMSAMEISTAAREGLPVKFFVLDDQAYHYMQLLQLPAYLRTTATILARLDYRALAQGFGVAYQEIATTAELEGGIRGAMCHPGPVLVRVVTDYRGRPIRWISAARGRFIDELSWPQRVRFLARIGTRALDFHKLND
ncbi:MAG: thiamine pyrophosphate-binding protein [Gemmataceae bacterium]|nr:thiamine pyrophosphate-binding protein [Gemmataceae bacterium]